MWKPTKTGIALRLNEWPTFKQAVDKLHRDNPTVANFTPCFLNLDHATPELIATCSECNCHCLRLKCESYVWGAVCCCVIGRWGAAASVRGSKDHSEFLSTLQGQETAADEATAARDRGRNTHPDLLPTIQTGSTHTPHTHTHIIIIIIDILKWPKQ